MKKTILIAIIWIGFISCQSKNIKIEGVIPDNKQTALFGKIGSEQQELLKDTNGKFKLETNQLNKGYYKINETLIFLAPGFDLNMAINDGIINFSGKGSLENNCLQKIAARKKKLNVKSKLFYEKVKLELEDFKSYLKEYTDWVYKLTKEEDLDDDFVIMENRKALLLTQFVLSKYVGVHGLNFKDTRLSDYASSLKREDFSNPKIMAKFDSIRKITTKDMLPRELRNQITSEIHAEINLNDEELLVSEANGFINLVYDILTQYGQKRRFAQRDKRPANREDYKPKELFIRDVIIDSISNKVVKEYFLRNATKRLIQSSEKYAKASYEIFTQNNTNKSYAKEIDEIYNSFLAMATGNPSPKFFNYESISDEKVSLDDFKGKYVYIDVWATWCGPCKKEIPFLKKVEKQYHGKNIVFLSISVDVQKSKKLWQNMVKSKQMTGVQLIADNAFKSDFITSYNIISIPRFILIDPEGNIISANAKRPSNPGLIEDLDSLNIK